MATEMNCSNNKKLHTEVSCEYGSLYFLLWLVPKNSIHNIIYTLNLCQQEFAYSLTVVKFQIQNAIKSFIQIYIHKFSCSKIKAINCNIFLTTSIAVIKS